MIWSREREEALSSTARADVIVIGSGVAGLSAALTAAEEGADVIVCEKQRALGGTSNFFQGTFAVESALQRAAFVTYTRDEAFRNIMEYSHWRADPRLVRAIVDQSAETITWLRKQGVEFSEVMNNMPDAPRTYHVRRGAGEAVVKALATRKGPRSRHQAGHPRGLRCRRGVRRQLPHQAFVRAELGLRHELRSNVWKECCTIREREAG
jgi:fumarate reductase flavoprotein subunit